MRIFYCVSIVVATVMLLGITGQGCTTKKNDQPANDSLAIRESVSSSPVVSPEESIKKMHLQDGFTVQLVAAEPLIAAPVAMSFDDSGRIWVLQMNDYMPDTVGTGEDKPTGKVVILSDKNGDGVMDERQIFLDSLVLPRAICLIEDGTLGSRTSKTLVL